MRAFLLLVLAVHSSALPLQLPTSNMDNWLLAEVRFLPEQETFKSLVLYVTVPILVPLILLLLFLFILYSVKLYHLSQSFFFSLTFFFFFCSQTSAKS